MYDKIKIYFFGDLLEKEKDTLKLANRVIILTISIISLILIFTLQIVYIFIGNFFQMIIASLSISIFIVVLILLKKQKGYSFIAIGLSLFSTVIFGLNLFLYPKMNVVNGLLMASTIIFSFNLLDKVKGYIFALLHLIFGIIFIILFNNGLSSAFIQPIEQPIIEQVFAYFILSVIVVVLILHYQSAHKNASIRLLKSIEELQISEARRKSSQAIGKIGNWDFNIETEALYWDDECYKITGIPLGTAIHKDTLTEIVHPDYMDFLLNSIDEALKGNPYHIDFKIILPSRTEKYITALGEIQVDENNKPLRFYGLFQDINERKITEKELRQLLDITSYQNTQLENFAYIVSHNVRSHSSNFTALINVLAEEQSIEESKKVIQMLKATANKLDSTLSNLSEIISSSENSSKLKIQKNLREEVIRTLDILSGLIYNHKIKIDINIPENYSIHVIPSYLDSILLNIISNAIKYGSTERSAFINITAERNLDYIILSIKDNGLGIDLNTHGNNIFGMYKTFHSNEDARGLGLFITKSNIEAMKGKIEVESTIGIGTNFKVYFNEKIV